MRAFFFAFIFLVLPLIPALAQLTDTTYFNKDGEKVKNISAPDADYFVITTYTDNTKSALTQNGFYLSGEKKSEKQFTSFLTNGLEVRRRTGQEISWYKNGQMEHKAQYWDGKEEGPDSMWFENGQIKSINFFMSGKKEGPAKTYYQDGKIKREEIFSDGLLKTGKCFTQAGADTVYFPAKTTPEFHGGDQALNQFVVQHMKYPRKALKNRIEGLVVVQFIVETNGKISDPKVVRKISPELDAESLRVVQLMSGQFSPATLEGQAVSFKYILPLRFGLK